MTVIKEPQDVVSNFDWSFHSGPKKPASIGFYGDYPNHQSFVRDNVTIARCDLGKAHGAESLTSYLVYVNDEAIGMVKYGFGTSRWCYWARPISEGGWWTPTRPSYTGWIVATKTAAIAELVWDWRTQNDPSTW